MRGLLLAALFLLAQFSATAQPPIQVSGSPGEESDYFTRIWRVDDGLFPLSSGTLLEAPEGYLWMESREGPVRFDGEKAAIYRGADLGWPAGTKIEKILPDDVQGIWLLLSDRTVWRERGGWWYLWARLAQDEEAQLLQPAGGPEGGVYLGTSAGRLLRCVDSAPGARELVPAMPDFSVWIGAPGALDTVWFAAGRRVFRWKAGAIVPAPIIAPDADAPIYFPWRDGSLWLVGQQNIWQWRDDAFRKLPQISVQARGGENIGRILPARPHGVWAATASHLFFLPAGATEWRGPFPKGLREPQRQETNLSDVNGNLWSATYGLGIFRVTPEGRQIPELLPPELAGNRLLNLLEDRERNIWAVAEGTGLVRLRARRFSVHRAGGGLSDPEVLAVAEDGAGALWAGSRAGGADVFSNRVWRHVTLPMGDVPGAGVSSLLPMADGSMLAGTMAKGVWQSRDGQWKSWGDATEEVRVLFADRSGMLWMGGNRGIANWQNSAWVPAAVSAEQPRVTGMTEDPAGNLWLATDSGVWRSTARGKFQPVPAAEGVPDGPAQSILAQEDGTIWIGSDRGLAIWRNGRTILYGPENGLPVAHILGLLLVSPDQLWVSSSDGLIVIDPRQFDAGHQPRIGGQIFTRADGLPTREASGGFQPSFWRSKDGRCWVPTHQGLVSFDPRAMPADAPPPPVILEDVTAFHDDHNTPLAVPPLRQGLAAALPMLPEGARRLEFRFTAPSLGAPEKVRFRWRIDGLDTAWSKASLQRFAAYSYIPPGEYRFRVIACNGDMVWNETGASFAFVVPRRWHERPAFWAGFALAFGSLLILVIRRRYLRRIERLRLIAALDHERVRIAQDIHDDLGATLTQISMWSAVGEDLEEPTAAGHFRLIRERSNDAVRSLDQIVWAVNPTNDTVGKFATYIGEAVSDFFRETGLACRIDLAGRVDDGPLNADVRHHLVLAAREACTNALRHAAATEVSLHVDAAPAWIDIVFTDNGRGFNSATLERRGEGLTNMQRRLSAIGGRCNIISSPGHGTRVEIHWSKST